MTLPGPDGDRIFARMAEVADALPDDALEAFLARLVFVLANEVGDDERVLAAIEAAAQAAIEAAAQAAEVREAPTRETSARGGSPTGRLGGRVVIVTGAGSSAAGVGIGDAIALLCAREGAAVCLVDRDPARLERTGATIATAGGRSEAVAADVTVAEECRAAVRAAIGAFGRLDVLVNNVGTTAAASFDELSEAEWDRVMNVNARSVALMTVAAAPFLERGGAVVNVASTGGLVASGGGVYGASKAAVVMLTRDLAVHYGRRGIRVNAIAPGHLHTPFVGELSPSLRRDRAQIAPLGLEGDAFDVARAAVFLAGEESRLITGVCLPVDAGVTVVSPLRAHRWLES